MVGKELTGNGVTRRECRGGLMGPKALEVTR